MFERSDKLKEIATQLVLKYERVGHVEIDNVLFLVNFGDRPKASARCYSLAGHPMLFLTKEKYCIVVYNANTDWMTDNQLAVLVLHELMHIPFTGGKLIDHNIKDFRSILDIDLDWCMPGHDVPDILEIGE